MKSRGMKSGGMKLMKHWCYYANVVRYLEKLEANAVKKKRRGAYLVWRDDEGPHMIAGPDIYWHRGAGPMPDLEGLNISIRSARAARVSKRSAPAVLSPPEKANKRRTTFPKPAQICSPKQQSRRRQSAVKTSISPMTRGRLPPKRTIVFSLAQGRSSGLAGRGVGHKVTAAGAAVTSRLESAPKPLASPNCNPLGPWQFRASCATISRRPATVPVLPVSATSTHSSSLSSIE